MLTEAANALIMRGHMRGVGGAFPLPNNYN
jgi:hypothetical protein